MTDLPVDIGYDFGMSFAFPQTALDWMLEDCGPSLLVMAESLSLPRVLERRGCSVVAIHRDPVRLHTAMETAASRVSARPEALPFGDCRFDAVFVHQLFADVAPGLALQEFARVLRPKGRLLISHLGRDDSVPWVHRLALVMQSIDETAMTAPSAADVLAVAAGCKYFKGAVRNFRHWEPVSREGLISMAMGLPAARRLDEAGRYRFVNAVAAVHDQAAGHNQLRLPYQLGCWRGVVDQNELTRPVGMDESGLVIRV